MADNITDFLYCPECKSNTEEWGECIRRQMNKLTFNCIHCGTKYEIKVVSK